MGTKQNISQGSKERRLLKGRWNILLSV